MRRRGRAGTATTVCHNALVLEWRRAYGLVFGLIAIAAPACASESPPAASGTPEGKDAAADTRPGPSAAASRDAPNAETSKTSGRPGGSDTTEASATSDRGQGDAAAEVPESDPFVDGVLDDLRSRWARVLDDPARFRFQFLITEIVEREDAGRDADAPPAPALVEHSYREDAEYVYPASAIKTFASVAALRKLQRLEADHKRRVNLDTPLAFCRGESTRCRTTDDETNLEGGVITLGHEIRKMQLVSNNTAFNRLMQFVGFDEFHDHMRAMGFTRTFVRHPLWVARPEADPTYTARVELRPARGKAVVIAGRAATQSLPPTKLPGQMVGRAYLDEAQGKARVDAPMDFAAKNFAALRDFHRLTLGIVLPGDPRVPDLGLDARKLKFLRRAMTQDPLESKNPVYTDEKKSALRYKPMLEGVLRVRKPSRIEYVSKAGRAYGFHLENAYIRDRTSGRAFVVTVAIYVNDNGVLNDDLYQYDGVSRPLLKDLGEVLARRVFDPPAVANDASR